MRVVVGLGVSALAIALACGGRTESDPIRGDGASDGTDDGGEPMTGEGAGGAGNEPPDNIGNIGGAQFIVATRCDACGWRRSDERCLDLVSSMPFVGDPLYYPCLDVSLDFAVCVQDDGGLCDEGHPSSCNAQRQAVDACN
ncbi:MAG TPA: hypothetical protein VMG12_28200 [Polyangiaceae bacterium]|nr:hypothetical protein [Polyangiaceae bacterium]